MLHGDGGDDRLRRRIRAHGNFAEYVPLILLLAALLELAAGRCWRHGWRILSACRHRFGSVQQYVCRGLPAVVTLAVLLIAGLLLVGHTV